MESNAAEMQKCHQITWGAEQLPTCLESTCFRASCDSELIRTRFQIHTSFTQHIHASILLSNLTFTARLARSAQPQLVSGRPCGLVEALNTQATHYQAPARPAVSASSGAWTTCSTTACASLVAALHGRKLETQEARDTSPPKQHTTSSMETPEDMDLNVDVGWAVASAGVRCAAWWALWGGTVALCLK